MNAIRFLFLVLFSLSFLLPVRAFQIAIPKRVAQETGARAGLKAGDDELAKHRSAAETYQLSGDLENAAIENRFIVSIALRRLANIAIAEGQSKRGSEILRESINASDSVEARTNLALIEMQSGAVDEGIGHARAAVDLDPDSAVAQETLGKLLYLKGDHAGALPPLERVLILKPNFDAAYALGTTYLQLKQLERAKLLFEEMLTAVTNKAALHVMFGKAFQDANYPVEAERAFKQAIALDPKVPRAHFYLGYLILQEGGSERLSEAGKHFQLELRINPRDPYSYFFAGVVASSENDHAAAIRHLHEATRLSPAMGTAFLFLGQSQGELGQAAAAEKSLRKAIELSRDASKNSFEIRRAHFLLGRLLIKLGRGNEGEAQLAKARELQGQLLESTREELSKILGQVVSSASKDVSTPRVEKELVSKSPVTPQETARRRALKDQLAEIVAQAYHNLGVVATQQRQRDDSISNFTAAARWKPNFPGLDRNWGIVAFGANQFEKAIAPLSRHVKADPADALTRRMLGLSYYFTKNYKMAAETLKPMESTIFRDSELAYFYGISLVQLERQAEASAVFGRLADQNQRSAQARFYAGQGLVLTGDYKRAVEEFRAAATLDPPAARAHYSAGQALIRMNLLDEAEKEFRQELQLNPADENAKYHLAYTLLERNTGLDEALVLLREAIAARYDYADARYHLGKALIARGEISEAIQQLQTAADLEPKKDYIHYQLSIAFRRASRLADAERELKLYRDLKAQNRSENPPGMGNKKDVP